MSQDLHSFDELEQSLRQLPLRKPSPELDERVLSAIQRPSRNVWRIGLIGGALAAAAMVLVAIWLTAGLGGGSSAPTMVANTNPAGSASLEITEILESWQDDGIVGYAANGPVRQYRVQTIEQAASADGEPRIITQESVVQYVAATY